MKYQYKIILITWLLISLNVIMSFTAIWIFRRTAPAIENITKPHEKIMTTSEKIVSYYALNSKDLEPLREEVNKLQKLLEKSSLNNQKYQLFFDNYQAALTDPKIRKKIIPIILNLRFSVMEEMKLASLKAKQLSKAGAWEIVFMALLIFTIGLFFIKSIKKDLISPLVEISDVLEAVNSGDNIRRCNGKDISFGIKNLFDNLNNLLDNRK